MGALRLDDGLKGQNSVTLLDRGAHGRHGDPALLIDCEIQR